jgi:hypothetical protein
MGTLKEIRLHLYDTQHMKYRAVKKAKLGSIAGVSAGGSPFLHRYPLRHLCFLRTERCNINIADRTQLQYHSFYRSLAPLRDITRPLLPTARPTGLESA